MIVVVADDITGAAEIAGVCLRYGLSVSFGINSVPDQETDVCVISTDSRSETETEAYNIHKKIAEKVLTISPTFIFKKCDSVLRGFVLTELWAILEAGKFKKVILQPANPASNRFIQNGSYYIGNEKIENTGFHTDPDFPATTSVLKDLLLQRSPKWAHYAKIFTDKSFLTNTHGIFLLDCNSMESLNKCSELAINQIFSCGSAAFFEQILISKGIVHHTFDQPKTLVTHNFLLVSGSTHPSSRQFADLLRDSNCPLITFPDSMIQKEIDDKIIHKQIKELCSVWNQKQMLTLSISNDNIYFFNSSTILKQRMGLLVQGLLKNCEIKELLIEGGATAYSILSLLNWKTLIPIEEVSPGVVRMTVSQRPEIHLTIKPGSYSWPTKFIQIAN